MEEELAQLGRHQKGAAERLVIKVALLSLIELQLEGSEQKKLSNNQREEHLDSIFLCASILRKEKS